MQREEDSIEKNDVRGEPELPGLSDGVATTIAPLHDGLALKNGENEAAAQDTAEKGLVVDDAKRADEWDWDADPDNPYNWSKKKRWAQVGMAASFAFVA